MNSNIERKPGDWNCSCGELNFASRTSCRKCCKTRTTSVQMKSGEWQCGCGKSNFSSRMSCRSCDKNKPVSLSTFISGMFFKSCDNNKPVSSKPGDWTCPSCNELNFGNRTVCRKCETLRCPLKETKDDGNCAVCFENPADVCLKECGHIAICQSCASIMNACPICRKPYKSTDIIKYFKVV